MPYGFVSYDLTGKVQFDSETLTFALQRSGQAVSQMSSWPYEASLLRVTGTTDQDMVALTCADGYAASYSPNGGSGGERWFVTNAPVGTPFTFYIYRPSSQLTPAPSGFGLEVYNPLGQLTFSSMHHILQAPAFWQGVGRGYQPAHTKPGRKLGFCLMGYGGFKEYGNMDQDSGGYSYDHNWFNVGCQMSNGGQTVSAVMVASDAGRYFEPNPSFNFANVYDVNSDVLVVDVTAVPVGQTFF